jgi:Zn-dependent oligopeptidase
MGFRFRGVLTCISLTCIFLSPFLGTLAPAENSSGCKTLLTPVKLLSSRRHPEIPWGRFSIHDLIPALERSIAQYKKDLEKIVANPQPPSAENTFLAEEEAAEAIKKIQAIFWNESLVNSNPEVTTLEDDFMNRISQWHEYRVSHPGFLARAKELGEPVYESFLKSPKGVVRGFWESYTFSRFAGLKQEGAWLPPAKKSRIFALSRRINSAHSKFVQNVLRVRDSIKLRVTDVAELEGLSARAIERARKYGEQEGVYLIPVSDKSLVGEIQTRAKSRALRRKLWYSKAPEKIASAFITAQEAGEAWKASNENLIQQITALNTEYAKLLGHSNFAEYQLHSQMISGSEGLRAFFSHFIPPVLKSAQAELRQLARYARKLDRIDRIEEWDVPYYSQLLMKDTFGFNDADLSEYFELETTIASMLRYAEKRFPIRFELKEGAASYHPSNSVYEIIDTRTSKKISEVHLDPLHRPGKQPFQGWEYLFRARGVSSQGDLPAVMSVSMGIEPAEAGEPVLLDFERGVQLAFHEFMGHALHESSDISKIPGMAGTMGIFSDGVETPSMIAEEFARDPIFLRMATHYRTGKPLPEKWLKLLTDELPKFNSALKLLTENRTLSRAFLDFSYGLDPPQPGENFIDYEERKLGRLNLFKGSLYAPIGHDFIHHFGGGMECLYFSYLTGAVKGAFVAEFLFRQEYNQPMKFLNYWDHVLAPSGRESDINFLIEQFTGEGITLHPYFERYGF